MTVRLTASKKHSFMFSLAAVMTLSLWGSPSWAGDPFRSSNPCDIGDKTEAAFKAMFEQGNYTEAKQYITEAVQSEEKDPLAHALRAGLAFTEGDGATLNTYATKTLEAAESLKSQDPLRGNLYLAVGYFLEGAYLLQNKDQIGAVSKLQQVFQSFDEAEKLSPNDPELNLIKGYLDLLLAVYLPFSNPDQAIQRFQSNAAPEYLVYRGIASAYRDLKQYDKALDYINKTLQVTPNNPEVLYLKGQILRKLGNQQQDLALLKQAQDYLTQSEAKKEQLPKDVQKAIDYDKNKVTGEISKLQASRS